MKRKAQFQVRVQKPRKSAKASRAKQQATKKSLAPSPVSSLANIVESWSVITPDASALKCLDSQRCLTYKQLHLSALRVAALLKRSYSIKPGDRVALIAHNDLNVVVLFLALQHLNAILVPLNTRLTPHELSFPLQNAAPKLVITETVFASLFSEVAAQARKATWICLDGTDGLIETAAQHTLTIPDLRRASFEENSACMILYTSGTTGTPKGALITHRMIFWNAVTTGLRLNLTSSDTTVNFAPFFHTGGWNVLLTPLLFHGACVKLMRRFEATAVLNALSEEGVTILFGVPTMLDLMAQAEGFKSITLNKLRYAIVGGEPMPVSLIHQWHAKKIPIRQGYGLTEFGPNVFSLNEEHALQKIGSIGFANPFIQTRIVDENLEDVADETVGELLLSGPACTPGYWKNEKATSEAIVNGWLRTGDLVRKDTDGFFFVVGRKKDMYISGGENVYPVEIEQVLRLHPDVMEAAVVGVADTRWGEVGKAFIVPKSDSNTSVDSVRAFCAERLARFKIPKHFTFVKALPKSDSGKILKRALI